MAITPADRVLRQVTVWAMIPALAFLIPHGVESRRLFPALGLVPMALSVVYGLVQIAQRVRINRVVGTIIDTSLAFYLLGMLIPSWILINNYWGWGHKGIVMVGTYGTVPLMVNFCIHTYFALRGMAVLNVFGSIFSAMFSSPTCPHCQREVLFHWPFPGTSTPSSESYVPVSMVNDEAQGRPSISKDPASGPRPSTDDETARLV